MPANALERSSASPPRALAAARHPHQGQGARRADRDLRARGAGRDPLSRAAVADRLSGPRSRALARRRWRPRPPTRRAAARAGGSRCRGCACPCPRAPRTCRTLLRGDVRRSRAAGAGGAAGGGGAAGAAGTAAATVAAARPESTSSTLVPSLTESPPASRVGGVDPHAVHERPVAGAQVLDLDLAVSGPNDRVAARDLVVVDREAGVVAADDELARRPRRAGR